MTGSTNYDVDSIALNYLPTGEWTIMDGIFPKENEQIYEIQLPHCHPSNPVTNDLQIRKYYAATSTYVYSEVQQVDRAKIRKYRNIIL